MTEVRKNYKITLRDTRDGTVKTITDSATAITEEADPSCLIVYCWTEGTFECDCNRGSLMYPDDESKHIGQCNSGAGLIELVDIRNEDGTELDEYVEHVRVEKEWEDDRPRRIRKRMEATLARLEGMV